MSLGGRAARRQVVRWKTADNILDFDVRRFEEVTMNCPVCNVELKMADRQGIEIDYCPRCRGIWLDRGELDKIIERSNVGRPEGYREDYPEERGYREPRQYHEQHGSKEHYRKKRRSFLEDLFDFD
jgi:hypothetical protein